MCQSRGQEQDPGFRSLEQRHIPSVVVSSCRPHLPLAWTRPRASSHHTRESWDKNMSNHIVTLPAAAWPPLEFYHINCIWTVSCDHAAPIGVLVFQEAGGSYFEDEVKWRSFSMRCLKMFVLCYLPGPRSHGCASSGPELLCSPEKL